MAISREKKEELVKEYTESLSSSEALIVTDFRGLPVSELQALRARIREAEGSFTVVKNTLARRALEEAGLPIVEEMLTGPVAFGYCNQNITGVAKAIADFSKDNDQLTIKGGFIGTEILSEAAVKELASLPSIEVLRAQLLGLLNAPASRLAGVMAGSVRQLVNVLNAYSEEAPEAAAETS